MRPLRHVETWGNGAIIMEPIYPEGPVLLNPGDTLVKGYSTYTLSTPAAYDAEYGKFHEPREVKGPEAATLEKENRNHPYIYGRASCIVAGEHPDKGKTFIKVKPGMIALVDGKYYKLVGTANNNLGLEELEEA